MARLRNAGRVYRLQREVTGINAAIDLITITPTAHSSLIVLAYGISNVNNAATCSVETAWSQATGGSASGGSSLTPRALDGEGGSPDFTAKYGVTGLTYTGATDEDARGWQSVVGYHFRPPTMDDALWLPCVGATEWSLRTINAPATSFTGLVTVDLMEVVG